jgi:hypothetical protein
MMFLGSVVVALEDKVFFLIVMEFVRFLMSF